LEYWRDSAAAGTQIDSQVLIQPICEISDKASLHEDRRKQNPNLRTGSQGPLGTRGKQYCAAVTPPSPMSSSKQTYENVIHDRPISTSNTYITPIDDRSADMQHLSSPAVQPMSMSLTPLINANLSIKDFAEETNLTDAEKNRVTQNIIWEKLVGEVTQVEDNFRVPPFQTRPEEYQSQVQTEIGLLRPEPEVTDEQVRDSNLHSFNHLQKTNIVEGSNSHLSNSSLRPTANPLASTTTIDKGLHPVCRIAQRQNPSASCCRERPPKLGTHAVRPYAGHSRPGFFRLHGSPPGR
jgi:hypothetical protein